MNNVRSGIFWRIIWACAGIALAANSIVTFNGTESYSALILAVGWLFMAVTWFMQPVILTANLKLSEVKAAQAPYVIGSPWARVFFSFAGMVLVILGFTLRLLGAA